MDHQLVRISRRLSFVLRHDPGSVGLTLDGQGWVPVDALLAALAATGPAISRTTLDQVVAGNDKQRFAVETGPDGVDRIRASQGHSRRVPVDLALTPVTPPATLYHGTPTPNLPSILAEGLRPRRRHHVHLSADVTTARSVGRRRGTDETILDVDAHAMAANGYAFYRSANGVWLTDQVPAAYLRQHANRPG